MAFRSSINIKRQKERVLSEVVPDPVSVNDLREIRDEYLSEDVTQGDVDDLFLSLALIEAKNHAFAEDVARAAQDEFIVVPDNRFDIIKANQRVLGDLDINSGKKIPFIGFKRLVDQATRPVNVQEIIDGMTGDPVTDTVFIGALADGYVNRDGLEKQRERYQDKLSEDKPNLWAMLGIATASLYAMDALHRMSAQWSEKNKEEDEAADDAAIRAAATPEQQAKVEAAISAKRTKKWALRIIKIAKAVAFFILFHKLSEREAQNLINETVRKNNIPDDLIEEMTEAIINEVENPPSEVDELLALESGGDSRSIIDFCLTYIDTHPEKDYSKWILYSQARIRARNIRNILNQGRAYMSDEAVKTSSRFNEDKSRTESVLLNLNNSPDFYRDLSRVNDNRKHISPSYFEILGEYRDEANIGINYARRLLNSNKYNPALICCLMKYLGSMDLDFLRKLRSTFKMLGGGFGFNTSRYGQDLSAAIYGDLQEQLLIPLLGIVDTTVQIWIRDNITDWLLEMEEKHETLFMCTPIRDMALAMAGAIRSLSDWVQDMMESLFDILFKVEINSGHLLPVLTGQARFRTVFELLDLVLGILETGESCDVSQIRSNVNQLRRRTPVVAKADEDILKKDVFGDYADQINPVDLDGNPLSNDNIGYENDALDKAGGREIPTDEDIETGYSRDTLDAIIKNEFCYKRMTTEERSAFEVEAAAILSMLDSLEDKGI